MSNHPRSHPTIQPRNPTGSVITSLQSRSIIRIPQQTNPHARRLSRTRQPYNGIFHNSTQNVTRLLSPLHQTYHPTTTVHRHPTPHRITNIYNHGPNRRHTKTRHNRPHPNPRQTNYRNANTIILHTNQHTANNTKQHHPSASIHSHRYRTNHRYNTSRHHRRDLSYARRVSPSGPQRSPNDHDAQSALNYGKLKRHITERSR